MKYFSQSQSGIHAATVVWQRRNGDIWHPITLLFVKDLICFHLVYTNLDIGSSNIFFIIIEDKLKETYLKRYGHKKEIIDATVKENILSSRHFKMKRI